IDSKSPCFGTKTNNSETVLDKTLTKIMPAVILPNILVTGTPGCGKTTTCKRLAEALNFKHQEVSEIVKAHDFTDGYDEELACPFLDEDKLLDYLEPIMQEGGNIVEYHSNELFPERWFQLVLVVRCDTQVLFDRLTARGYNQKKIEQNMSCEIFGTIHEEALDSYKPEIVHEIRSEKEEDFEKTLQLVKDFLEKWKKK
ncbi:adenylate kinase isoenzyme 6 homolog, partial [Culicoides brevitarsis]|uniref:adenylate kinase isoenzyme 6 homolog n=1 Tax=Culicoides brevitarsis TaxID=469753 RepID=UPI00307C1450